MSDAQLKTPFPQRAHAALGDVHLQGLCQLNHANVCHARQQYSDKTNTEQQEHDHPHGHALGGARAIAQRAVGEPDGEQDEN